MEEEKYLSAEAEGRNTEKIKNVFKKVRESESAKRIICRLALFAAAGIVFEFFVAYAFSPLYKGLGLRCPGILGNRKRVGKRASPPSEI